MDGQHLFTIPLQQLMEAENERIISFDYVNKDTIVLLSKYTNKIFIVNYLGELIFKKDYSKFALKNIELYPPTKLLGKKIFLGAEYQDIDLANSNVSPIEDYDRRNQSPQIFIDNNLFSSTYDVSLKLPFFYSRFSKLAGAMNLEGNKFDFSPIQFSIHSIYSDSVYFIDENFNNLKPYCIKSDFFELNLKPISILKEMKESGAININTAKSNFVFSFNYDKYREVYYCMVRGAKEGEIYPFSIITYDHNMKKLDEQYFEPSKYKLSTFIAKDGLFVENRIEDFKKRTFTGYRYE